MNEKNEIHSVELDLKITAGTISVEKITVIGAKEDISEAPEENQPTYE